MVETTSMRSDITLCCDASIIVDFVAAPEVAGIESLWQRLGVTPHRLVAPGLLLYEVTNAIDRIAHRTMMPLRDAQRVLELAVQMPIDLIDDRQFHRRAFALSRTFRLGAAYDAHYLALAESLECPFYTSDAKLVQAVVERLNWVHLV